MPKKNATPATSGTLDDMRPHDFHLSLSIKNATSGKSSLLIPDLQLPYFQSQCDQHGGLSAYLSWIVENYLPHITEFRQELNKQRTLNWNTVYQDRGQDLKKKNFIPNSYDWEALRQAAAACGVSICFLFVFLMRLEGSRFFEKIPKTSPVGRNSFPDRKNSEEKLVKFSIFSRMLDAREGILHRKLKTS